MKAVYTHHVQAQAKRIARDLGIHPVTAVLDLLQAHDRAGTAVIEVQPTRPMRNTYSHGQLVNSIPFEPEPDFEKTLELQSTFPATMQA